MTEFCRGCSTGGIPSLVDAKAVNTLGFASGKEQEAIALRSEGQTFWEWLALNTARIQAQDRRAFQEIADEISAAFHRSYPDLFWEIDHRPQPWVFCVSADGNKELFPAMIQAVRGAPAVPQGTEIHAADSGKVAYAGDELKAFGNLVLIRHANGWVSAYAHADQILVSRNDEVTRGQVIARAGKTGTVDQPQLHFELREGSRPVDPIPHMTN